MPRLRFNNDKIVLFSAKKRESLGTSDPSCCLKTTDARGVFREFVPFSDQFVQNVVQ